MRELVALDLPGGPAFVAAVEAAWAAGDAVLPVDRRLPAPARDELLAAARPHAVVTDDGRSPAGPSMSSRRVALDRAGPRVDEGDAVVVATSGTTGEPKLVVHTHAGVAAHANAVHAHLEVDPARDRWLACLPLAHLGGLGVVLRSIVTGTPVDVIPTFDARAVAAAPADLGTTLVSLVPTALDRLDAGAFRWVVLGGSGDPGHRPPNVVRTYGLTETGGGVVYDGRPLPGVEVRLAADGAVALRGPILARGRRRPDGTVDPITGADGWFPTGDLGTWSEDGRLHVHGRGDDLIVTGGENVWPGPVEAALAGHAGVAEVAVVGRDDAEWGRRVVAVVVPGDRAAPPTLEELRDHVRATLPAHAAPRELVLVDRLPRTTLGKVRRRDLLP
ncbi:MAG TPA: fatty acid--CoA ligase family protein [Aquihabitans sp.]|nr:fatty acid--CoA ligase family protein [Aquihabitans sp.]